MSSKLSKLFFILISLMSISLSFAQEEEGKQIVMTGEKTIVYLEENTPSTTSSKYYFDIKEKGTLLVSVYGQDDASEGKFFLWKSDSESKTEKDLIKSSQEKINLLADEGEEKTRYYIEYNYNSVHTFLLKFIFDEKEIYLVDTEHWKINEYYYVNFGVEENIYLIIDLFPWENGDTIPIKFVKDNREEFDIGKIKFLEVSQDDTRSTAEIINALISSTNVLEKNEEIKDIDLYYFKVNKSFGINLYLAITFPEGLRNFGELKKNKIVVYHDDYLYGGDYFQTIPAFSGVFLKYPLFEVKGTEKIIAYTSSKNILKIVGLTKDQEMNKDYIFGKSYLFENVWENDKLTIIDYEELNKAKGIENYYFEISNPQEDFFFQIMILDKEDFDISFNITEQTEENIQLIQSQIDITNTQREKPLIKIEQYKSFENVKYMFYGDIIKGDYLISYADMDKECLGNKVKRKFAFDPSLIEGEFVMTFYQNNLAGEDYIKRSYTYNNLVLKCNNFNEYTLDKGQYIYICLQPLEETSLNLPEGEFSLQLELKIHEMTSEKYSVLYTNSSGQENELNTIEKIYKDNWDETSIRNMAIRNNNNLPILLALKISEDKENIRVIDESIDTQEIQKEIVYDLVLPFNKNISDNKKFLGVFQEIETKDDLTEICVFHEKCDEKILTRPPQASCQTLEKGVYDLNQTISQIYSDKETDETFHTLIYFNTPLLTKNPFLNYKQMFTLVENSENTIFYDTLSKDIYYYILNSSEIDLESSQLFLSIIKDSSFSAYTPPIDFLYMNPFSSIKYPVYNYQNIFDSENKKFYGKLFDLIKGEDYIPVIKFFGGGEKPFALSYEFGNDFSYDFVQDDSVVLKEKEGTKNQYNINFKPFEKNGKNDYILYIFNSASELDLEELKNPYNVLFNSVIEKSENKLIFNDLVSVDGEFDSDSQKKIDDEILEINGEEGELVYILMIAVKESKPNTVKIYEAKSVKIEEIITEREIDFNTLTDDMDSIEAIFEPKEKYLIKVTKRNNNNNDEENGKFLIQWLTEEEEQKEGEIYEGKQTLTIFKGESRESEIVYKSTKDELYYLLDSKNVEENFSILYETGENEIKTKNKIIIHYISNKGISQYNDETYYIYMNSVVLPLYINTEENKNDLEIFKIFYKKNSETHLNILIKYFDKDMEIQSEEKKITDNELKHFNISSDEYYFGVFSEKEKTSMYMEITITLDKKYSLKDEENALLIGRVPVNDYSLLEGKQIISVNDETQFYFINLNKRLIEEGDSLLYFTNIIKAPGITFIRGNYFSSKNKEMTLPLNVVNKEKENSNQEDDDYENKNLLSIVTYLADSKQLLNNAQENFIELQKPESEFIVHENLNRSQIYNKNFTLEKLGKGSSYWISYYPEKIKDKNYTISYSVKTAPENTINFYYSNNLLSKSSIDEILSDLDNKIVTDKDNNIFNGGCEIFEYKYEIKNASSIIEVELKAEETKDEKDDDDDDDGKNDEEESNGGLIALIIALVFIGIVAILIMLFFICKYIHKNTSSEEIERGSTINNPLMSEGKIIKSNAPISMN